VLQYNVKSKGAVVGPQRVRLQQPSSEELSDLRAGSTLGDVSKTNPNLDFEEFDPNIEPSDVPERFLMTFATVEVVPGENFFRFNLESDG